MPRKRSDSHWRSRENNSVSVEATAFQFAGAEGLDVGVAVEELGVADGALGEVEEGRFAEVGW